MNKLSIIIYTENEEKFIADAVGCASFADELLAVDCVPTGKMCDIAEEIGTQVAQGWRVRGTKEQDSWACPQ